MLIQAASEVTVEGNVKMLAYVRERSRILLSAHSKGEPGRVARPESRNVPKAGANMLGAAQISRATSLRLHD
eukprot:CAMPEP_0170456004 /NCGR_PEP_ID=MMETSP0123-20130129/3782_1 /TAXON_ID=182087 /ORGANISM="Favella ehrenbergii, Strain Fehren 1" /LENGTH=71 /DNA_ID=CAMNT_0010719335 /DNA_START=129 /DNA_END=344 /DNA_ORIENTATION=-